jgi:septal ring factor EnvC (AmiA/AmiB activator)
MGSSSGKWMKYAVTFGPFILAALGVYATAIQSMDRLSAVSDQATLTSTHVSELMTRVSAQEKKSSVQEQKICDLKETLDTVQTDVREIRNDVKVLIRRKG